MHRLALIGGAREAETYARILPRIEGATLVAVVDDDAATARRTATTVGASIVAGSLEELVAGRVDDFDAVLIHSGIESHERQTTGAAKAGKHVLVQTPIAPSAESAQRMLQACEEKGYSVEEELNEEDGTIQLVVRKWVSG